MNELKDTYKTIIKASPESLFKDRGSKFYSYAFPVNNEEESKKCLENLKKQHYNARHWCFAWQLGKEYENYRVNDDGEPSNSAGMPIFGQIQAFDLTNVLVVVVRYFGGTKLGIGGLMKAYKTGAKMALKASSIIEQTIDEEFEISFDYPQMNTVMRIIKDERLKIKYQKLEFNCLYIIAVRKKDSLRIFNIFTKTYKTSIKRI